MPSSSINTVLTGLAFAVAIAGLLHIGSSAVQAKECEENELGRVYENLPAPSAPTTEKDIVHTRIGGRDFYVPKNYFRHPQVGCGVEESGMLLRVLLPDLKPFSEETRRVFETQPGAGDKMNILLTSEPPIIAFDKMVADFLEESSIKPPTDESYGLWSGQRKLPRYDSFFSRKGERVVRFIRCPPIRPNRGSVCSHRFRYLGHDVAISYDRKHLPKWRSIQASVEQLIGSLSRPPEN